MSTLFIVCCVVSALDGASTWRLDERGWLVAESATDVLFDAGPGFPVSVEVNDVGFPRDTASVERGEEDGQVYARYTDEDGVLTIYIAPFPALGAHARLRTLTYRNTSTEVQDITSATFRTRPVLHEGAPVWRPKHAFFARGMNNALLGVAYRGTTDFYRLHEEDGVVAHRVEACWRLAPGEEARVESQALWAQFPGAAAENGERWWGEAYREEIQRWYAAIDLRVPEDTPGWVRSMVLYEYNGAGHIDSRFSDVGGFPRLALQTPYLAELGVTGVWLQAPHQHKSPPNPVEGDWNLYDPLDIDVIDPILGGENGLRQLCDGLRAAGLRILTETVPHGGHSKQGQALPEWWSYERDGAPRRNWGGCGMDHASPPWQALIARSMEAQAARFGFDGCRIDVADGSGPNWNSPRTGHASFSTLGGALELLGAIHDAMSAATPRPLLIPEAFDQVEYFALSPVGYGHDFWMFIHNTIEHSIEAPRWMVAYFRDHLENERGSLPKGALTLRTLNNHDTVCEAGRVHQRFGAGLTRALHGLCLVIPGIPMLYQEQEVGDYFELRRLHQARAQLPALHHDAVDYCAVEAPSSVFSCLRGDAETGQVVALVNLSGDTQSGAIALLPQVALPENAWARDLVSGATAKVGKESRDRIRAFDWTLEPYATAMISFEADAGAVPRAASPGHEAFLAGASADAPKTETPRLTLEDGELYFAWQGMRVRFEAGPGEWTLGADDGEAQVFTRGMTELATRRSPEGLLCDITFAADEADERGWPGLAFFNSRLWMVSGRTGALVDRTLRRHYPWPEDSGYGWDRTMFWGPHPGGALYRGVSPTGRLWESVVEPLHPEAPAVGVADGEGRRILVHSLDTDARNVLLRDFVDADQDGEQHGLRLEFRGSDPDLAHHVNAVGLGQPFRLDHWTPGRDEVYTASFLLALNTGGATPAEEQALSALRLPVAGRGPHWMLKGPKCQSSGALGMALPFPGEAACRNVTLPEGRWRLRFTMRHSEVSADGDDLDDAYRISVNGVPLDFEWQQRNVEQHGNAWFGYAVTEPVDSGTEPCQIRIETLRNWCIIKKVFHLEAA